MQLYTIKSDYRLFYIINKYLMSILITYGNLTKLLIHVKVFYVPSNIKPRKYYVRGQLFIEL